MSYLCLLPSVEVKCRHFNASCRIHFGGVQKQNYEHCTSVQILMNPTEDIMWTCHLTLIIAYYMKGGQKCVCNIWKQQHVYSEAGL